MDFTYMKDEDFVKKNKMMRFDPYEAKLIHEFLKKY